MKIPVLLASLVPIEPKTLPAVA